ncbi:MAG: DJ-1 family glyoxalase III [Thermodesulfobacteriota bacterium]
MEKRVLVPVANGIEEMETVTIVDVLRRAGAFVTVASVGDPQITASRGIVLVADQHIDDCAGRDFDLIALPGGMPGAEKLRDSKPLAKLLSEQAEKKKLYAAICASPSVVLDHHGLLKSRFATCHPGFADKMDQNRFRESRVVVDENCVTSRGPGTALEFALKLVELLYSRRKAEETAAPMVADLM